VATFIDPSGSSPCVLLDGKAIWAQFINATYATEDEFHISALRGMKKFRQVGVPNAPEPEVVKQELAFVTKDVDGEGTMVTEAVFSGKGGKKSATRNA